MKTKAKLDVGRCKLFFNCLYNQKYGAWKYKGKTHYSISVRGILKDLKLKIYD